MNIDTMMHKPGNGKDSAWLALGLDWGERLLIIAFYARFAYRIIISYLTQGCLPNLIFLVSEGLAVFLIIIRRTTRDVSLRPVDWLLAFAGTVSPLLVYPDMRRALLPSALAGAIMLIGMLVQISAKLVLGRSWGCVPANRGLKFSGPYRFVRHPTYAGYLLTHIAFLLMNPTAWNLGVYVMLYSFQISRLLAEERLLRKDPRYADYMASVRYRLFPGVF